MEWDLLKAILSLVGVIGLILVFFYYLKKFGKGSSVIGGGKKLRVLDRIAVSRDSALAVVSVCGELMLIGISSHGITKLCGIDMTETEYLSQPTQKTSQKFSGNGISFSEVLANLTGLSGKNKAADVSEANENPYKFEGEITLETQNSAGDKPDNKTE